MNKYTHFKFPEVAKLWNSLYFAKKVRRSLTTILTPRWSNKSPEVNVPDSLKNENWNKFQLNSYYFYDFFSRKKNYQYKLSNLSAKNNDKYCKIEVDMEEA